MFSETLRLFLKIPPIRPRIIRRYLQVNAPNTGERDPAPIFFNHDVQKLLQKLTRPELAKIYKTRKMEKTLKPPVYEFMTDEQLKQAQENALRKIPKKLQMPPVVLRRKEVDEVLSSDPELQGLTDSKYVFTDISYGLPDRERLIVVRDPNGVLRKASWEERHRMLETYFPVKGRKMKMPKMFEDEHLQRLLKAGNYEFVLDRACLQFEPDDPQYQRVTSTTYNAVDEALTYDSLRSTRHFGPFAFHLAWNRSIDNLLLNTIQNDRLDESVALVKLYHKVNPEAKSAVINYENGKEHEFIKAYIAADSNKKNVLELALQTHIEMQREREELTAGISRAHGYIMKADLLNGDSPQKTIPYLNSEWTCAK